MRKRARPPNQAERELAEIMAGARIDDPLEREITKADVLQLEASADLLEEKGYHELASRVRTTAAQIAEQQIDVS